MHLKLYKRMAITTHLPKLLNSIKFRYHMKVTHRLIKIDQREREREQNEMNLASNNFNLMQPQD